MIFATKDYREFTDRVIEQQKAQYMALVADKDTQIRSLKMEMAQVKQENERLRTREIPSPVATQLSRSVEMQLPQDWQGELNQMLTEEENGIRSSRRVQEYKQSTDDVA